MEFDEKTLMEFCMASTSKKNLKIFHRLSGITEANRNFFSSRTDRRLQKTQNFLTVFRTVLSRFFLSFTQFILKTHEKLKESFFFFVPFLLYRIIRGWIARRFCNVSRGFFLDSQRFIISRELLLLLFYYYRRSSFLYIHMYKSNKYIHSGRSLVSIFNLQDLILDISNE